MMLIKTKHFDKWLRRIKDLSGKAKILAALRKCEIAGKIVGDSKSVGGGVYELRIHAGPGYRIYYANSAGSVVLLLIGGDKSSQRKDIEKAREILREIEVCGL